MGPKGSPETSVRNYHYWLRNSSEEPSSLFYKDRRSKSVPYCGVERSLLLVVEVARYTK